MSRMEELKAAFRTGNPDTAGLEGFRFDGTLLVAASDGSPSPAYDVKIRYSFPKTPAELEQQARDREVYIAHREADFLRREREQKALLESVIHDIQEKIHNP